MRRLSEASPMADRRVILSLGAGVQSTTLALMAARGDLSPGVSSADGWRRSTLGALSYCSRKLEARCTRSDVTQTAGVPHDDCSPSRRRLR
jgi:hypothetical protein